MADKVLVPAHQYIDYVDGEFILNDEYQREIESLQGPLYVFTCVGRYRTGKSFFLNRLFNTQEEGGFLLGRTIESATRGIWIWVKRIDGRTVVLVDTEGLYVPKNSGMNFDNKILALALLLSSLFVLNTTGTIDRSSINQLEFVVELTKNIKTYASKKGDLEDYQEFFPVFIWLVRDFFLELRNDQGEFLTDNQYLEDVLRTEAHVAESDTEMRKLSRTKDYIKRVFPRRQCFTLTQPVNDSSLLSRVHEMPYEDLQESFRTKLDGIVSTLVQGIPKKAMFGRAWNGRIFFEMSQTFVQHVNSDAFIMVDQSFAAVVASNNQRVLATALETYREGMRTAVETLGGFPIEEEDLEGSHRRLLDEVMETVTTSLYEDMSAGMTVHDAAESFRMDLVERNEEDEVVDGIYFSEFVRPNRSLSRDACLDFLKDAWTPIDEQFDSMVKDPHGVERYEELVDEVRSNYFNEPKLGPMRKPVFDEFMTEKENEKIKMESMNSFVVDQLKRTRALEASLAEKRDELDRLAEQVEMDKTRLRKEKATMADERDRIQKEFDAERERVREEARLAAAQQMQQQADDSAKCGGLCEIM